MSNLSDDAYEAALESIAGKSLIVGMHWLNGYINTEHLATLHQAALASDYATYLEHYLREGGDIIMVPYLWNEQRSMARYKAFRDSQSEAGTSKSFTVYLGCYQDNRLFGVGNIPLGELMELADTDGWELPQVNSVRAVIDPDSILARIYITKVRLHG